MGLTMGYGVANAAPQQNTGCYSRQFSLSLLLREALMDKLANCLFGMALAGFEIHLFLASGSLFLVGKNIKKHIWICF